MENIRKFSLIITDDLDNEVERKDLQYVESPSNLGFDLQLEVLGAGQFGNVESKNTPVQVTVVFLPPNAYAEANQFKNFIQRTFNSRLVLEYDDTTGTPKRWEGKVQKFGQTELEDWGGLLCPISFLPSTQKYINKTQVVDLGYASTGKSYPTLYPYFYSQQSAFSSETIANDYFEEAPLRVALYGELKNPQISLQDVSTGEIYTTVRFINLTLSEGQHIIVDSIRSKILLYINGEYTSIYDMVSKQSRFDSFLYVRPFTTTRFIVSSESITNNALLYVTCRQYAL